MSGTHAPDPGEKISRRLESVSPSRYGKLREWREGRTCGLQLLWQGKPPLAPYAAAKLGDVVHRMMERLPAVVTETDAKAVWDEALAHTESRLNDNWVTRGLLPLSRTVRGYSLKKILTIRSVLKSGSGNESAGAGGWRPATLREEKLQSEDGLLKGQADLIEQRDGEWVLLDYKSGTVHEIDEESGGQRIKDDYALQVKLYAHLIRETKGIIVSKALLRTLDGCEHEVEVDQAGVQEAGAEARALLGEFNNEIQRLPSPLDLASPMPACWERGVFGCAGCLYRPWCPAYHGFEKKSLEGERWPRDVWGTVNSIERVEESLVVEIQNENRVAGPSGTKQPAVVTTKLRDLDERHPNLSNVRSGDIIQVYDFVAPRLGIVVEDGPRTCVYSGAITRA